jgi:uncharacterized membrane protein
MIRFIVVFISTIVVVFFITFFIGIFILITAVIVSFFFAFLLRIFVHHYISDVEKKKSHFYETIAVLGYSISIGFFVSILVVLNTAGFSIHNLNLFLSVTWRVVCFSSSSCWYSQLQGWFVQDHGKDN